MSVGDNLRKLGRFLETCEERGGTIHNVEFVECIDPDTEVRADIDLTVSPSNQHRESFAPAAVEIDDNGGLRLTVESTSPVVPSSDYDIDITPMNGTIDADGAITITLGVSVPSEIEATGRETTEETDPCSAPVGKPDETTDTPDTGSERDVPPFRDPELLTTVYESCDTFAEMSEAIEMDVTAETVRRYMIDYGIHEPKPYDTENSEVEEPVVDSDADIDGPSSTSNTDDDHAAVVPRSEHTADTRTVLTDGIGLPSDVSVETLVETVSRANTIYEVKQDLGLDRDETLELLRQLDLVDLVTGRVSTEHKREIGREGIIERLRDVSLSQS